MNAEYVYWTNCRLFQTQRLAKAAENVPLSSSYGVGSHCRAVLHSLDQLQDATSAIGRTTRRLRSDVCVKSELGAAPSSEIQVSLECCAKRLVGLAAPAPPLLPLLLGRELMGSRRCCERLREDDRTSKRQQLQLRKEHCQREGRHVRLLMGRLRPKA
eukprot:GHVT01005218.1.p1 GENE.GHVT01005218.1~~GHVT01005218.1.p1  ORF type:complete len:158 (+),score=22.73 GHVT01005218.1:2551-3024(+)